MVKYELIISYNDKKINIYRGEDLIGEYLYVEKDYSAVENINLDLVFEIIENLYKMYDFQKTEDIEEVFGWYDEGTIIIDVPYEEDISSKKEKLKEKIKKIREKEGSIQNNEGRRETLKRKKISQDYIPEHLKTSEKTSFLKNISNKNIIIAVVVIGLLIFAAFTILLGIWVIPAFIFAYRAEKWIDENAKKYSNDQFSWSRLLKNSILGPIFIHKYYKTFGTLSLSI